MRLYYVQRTPPFLTIANKRMRPQPYFPTLEKLFPSLQDQIPTADLAPTLASTELVYELGSKKDTAWVENLLTKEFRYVPVWTRIMHLVNPLDVMEGILSLPEDGALPSTRRPWQRTLRKINDPLNEAYTDAVFACLASRMVETNLSPHWCRFYGTFNDRVPEYKYNITMDMPKIGVKDWFREGLTQSRYRVIASDSYDPENTAELTHPWDDVRAKILRKYEEGTEEDLDVSDEEEEEDISEDEDTMSEDEDEDEDEDESSDDSDIEVETISEDSTNANDITPSTESSQVSCGDSASGTSEEILEDLTEVDNLEVVGETVLVQPRIRLSRISGSGSAEQSSEISEDDDVDYHLYTENFPVQITVLERCEGTMDALMEEEEDEDGKKEERWTAWIFQVVAALTTAQQLFEFVHNDLHTNNVMWTTTDQEYLYYEIKGATGKDRYYRVPTYGKLFKIIDFGRATFRPPMKGEPVWIPDAYGPDADAEDQYNCGPYYQPGKPKVSPNKSFDLCRLSIALLETLWEEKPSVKEPAVILTEEPGRIQYETTSPLWNLIWTWLTDKDGKNLLRSPDDSERYQFFDLYCAIARDSQNAVPKQQVTRPIFDTPFRCRRKDIPTHTTIWKLFVR